MQQPRHIAWFSCGAASAVAAKLVLAQQPDALVVRIVIDNEHPDNDRFTADCERWYGREIVRLRSTEYRDVDDVIERRRFLVSPYGAPCSTELKKRVREQFQRPFVDIQYFGFDLTEQDRAQRFSEANPEANARYPLIEASLTKDDCFGLLTRAGIALPAMYELGYRNNNCIGCVKANSLHYWRRIRRDFPEVYERRARQERMVGASINRDRETGERWWLDELGPRLDTLPLTSDEPNISCGILCEITYQEVSDAAA